MEKISSKQAEKLFSQCEGIITLCDDTELSMEVVDFIKSNDIGNRDNFISSLSENIAFRNKFIANFGNLLVKYFGDKP